MRSNTGQRIATNAIYLFTSQVLTWGLSLVTAVIVPRFYGAEGIGQYSLAGSLWGITALLVGFGTDVVINREIARNRELTSELVTAGLFQRVAMHVIGFAVISLFANVAGYSRETVQIVYIFGAANLLFQIGHIFSAALYGLEKMGRLSLVGVLIEVIGTVGILVAILLGQSIVVAATVSIVAGAVRAVLLFRILRSEYPLRLEWRFARVRWLVREGVSILGNRLARNLYTQADIIVISLFVNETVVGWYAVADVAYGSLLFVANTAGTALFPAFSRLFKEDQEELGRLTRRGFNLLLLAAVPIGLGTTIVATPLLVLVVGEEFTNAGIVLSGFGVVAIVTSINIYLSQLLIAMGRQNRLTAITALAVVLTYPIDFVLIPWTQSALGNGAIGGVIAYLITESVILFGCLRTVPAGILRRENTFFALRALVAGALMFAAVWPARDMFLLWPILLGMVAYGTAAIPLRLVSREDVNLAKDLLRRGWQRLRRRMQASTAG